MQLFGFSELWIIHWVCGNSSPLYFSFFSSSYKACGHYQILGDYLFPLRHSCQLVLRNSKCVYVNVGVRIMYYVRMLTKNTINLFFHYGKLTSFTIRFEFFCLSCVIYAVFIWILCFSVILVIRILRTKFFQKAMCNRQEIPIKSYLIKLTILSAILVY